MKNFHELFRNAGTSAGAKEGWLQRLRGVHKLTHDAQQATTNSAIKGGNGVDASFHAQDATRHALRTDHFAHEKPSGPAYEFAANAHALASRAHRDASQGGGRFTSFHKSLATFHSNRSRELDQQAKKKPSKEFQAFAAKQKDKFFSGEDKPTNRHRT